MTRIAFALPLLLAAGLGACATSRPADTAAGKLVEARFATFNRHDLDGIARLYAADAVLTSPGFCAPRKGEDGVRRSYADLFKSYPDISDDNVSYVAEGDRIAVRYVTHVGKYAVPIASFLTVRDGLIAEDDAYFDAHGQTCS